MNEPTNLGLSEASAQPTEMRAKPRSCGEPLVTGATYRYVPAGVEVTRLMVDVAFWAGSRWFREHPDGASSDDEWRDFHRTVLLAALNGVVD